MSKAMKLCLALVLLSACAAAQISASPGVTGGTTSSGSGTVSANSGSAGALCYYAAAGGSTVCGPTSGLVYNGTNTLTIGGVGLGTGTALFGGNTSGSGSIGCSSATCPALTTSLALFVGAGGVKAVAASGFESQGTTYTSNAGCAETALLGGASFGKFASGTTGACTTTITMGNALTTTNGWVCLVYDESTGALGTTTGSTTTTATLTVATTSGNTVKFLCGGF
jgi:hypothetical protein